MRSAPRRSPKASPSAPARWSRRPSRSATPSEVAITQALLPGAVGPAAKQPPRKLSAEFLRDHAGDNHYDAATHRGAFPDGRVGSDPALASAELGSRLLAAAVEDAVADYRAFLEEK